MFYSQLKSKVGNIIPKAATLRINVNIDGAPIAGRSYPHPSHSQTRLLISSLSLGVLVPHVTHVGTRVLQQTFAFSLALALPLMINK